MKAHRLYRFSCGHAWFDDVPRNHKNKRHCPRCGDGASSLLTVSVSCVKCGRWETYHPKAGNARYCLACGDKARIAGLRAAKKKHRAKRRAERLAAKLKPIKAPVKPDHQPVVRPWAAIPNPAPCLKKARSMVELERKFPARYKDQFGYLSITI
jgi:hypothetical protein